MLQLHEYQRVAANHLANNPRAGLLLDMGLGKTAATLAALTPERLPALVVAPKRVVEEVWPVEVPKWRPDLSIVTSFGARSSRLAALARTADITAVTRDNLRDVHTPAQYRTVILDELSSFKNRQSIRWKTARNLTRPATQVWGLTGTPAPNGYMDLWAQIYLLDGGERLGRTITGYRSRFFIPGRILPSGVVCDWRLKPGAAEHIDALLEDICLSMRAAHYLDIPPLVMNKVTVPLDNATMNTYRRMQKDLVADLTLIGGEIHTAANAAVMSSKLRQISAGFIFNDNGQGYTPLHSHKAEAIREIVDGTGSPVLVLYQFIPERDMLLRKLDGLAHLVSEPDAIKRWNRREIPVLLAHPASIGHGLNLQSGGHTMIWASIPWSLEEWEQTNARLARQGQQHSHVIQHVLLSPGTLDSQILAVVQGKKTVQDALKDALRYKDMELI